MPGGRKHRGCLARMWAWDCPAPPTNPSPCRPRRGSEGSSQWLPLPSSWAPSPLCVWATGCTTCWVMGGNRNKQAPPSQPLLTCAQCQLLPSPRPAGPQRQWCQPWGCQEACCHANGPGWAGAMVMSSSWGPGQGHEGASPAGQLLPLSSQHFPAPQAPGRLCWNRVSGPQGAGLCGPHPGTASAPLPAPFRFSG